MGSPISACGGQRGGGAKKKERGPKKNGNGMGCKRTISVVNITSIPKEDGESHNSSRGMGSAVQESSS